MNLWVTSNPKGWLNFAIFSFWLKHFDEYVAQTNEIKVALLAGNTLSHGRIQDLPVLSNAEAIYLPKNAAACLRPLDAGLIASLKKRYRGMQYRRALCLLEEEIRRIYTI